jgi:hypothetical protein
MQILEARNQAVGNDDRANSDSTVGSGMVVSLFADHLMRSIGCISLARPEPATLTETAFAFVLPHTGNCA